MCLLILTTAPAIPKEVIIERTLNLKADAKSSDIMSAKKSVYFVTHGVGNG
jgi:hypothetical protein